MSLSRRLDHGEGAGGRRVAGVRRGAGRGTGAGGGRGGAAVSLQRRNKLALSTLILILTRRELIFKFTDNGTG